MFSDCVLYLVIKPVGHLMLVFTDVQAGGRVGGWVGGWALHKSDNKHITLSDIGARP